MKFRFATFVVLSAAFSLISALLLPLSLLQKVSAARDTDFHPRQILAQSSCVPAPNGLVAWWRGEGDATDMVGTHHGTLNNGASFASGVVGQAFNFDGSDDYVEFGQVVSSSPFTIEFWIKSSSDQTSLAVPLSQGHTGESVGTGFGFQFQSYGAPYLGVQGFGYPRGIFDYSGSDTSWHHVALAHDTDESSRVYLDGVIVPVREIPGGEPYGEPEMSWTEPFSAEEYGLVFGDDFLHRGRYWHGLLDEVAVYDRALQAEEVGAIFDAGEAGKCAPDATQTPTPTQTRTPTPTETEPFVTNTSTRTATAGPSPTPVNCAQIPSGIVAWWRGEGNAADAVGQHNGTLENGTNFVPGVVGEAFNFDGSGDFASFGQVIPSGPFSIELWMRSTTVQDTLAAPVSQGHSDHNGFALQFRSHDVPSLSVVGLGNPRTFEAYPSDDLDWHHIAVTHDENHRNRVFVDAVNVPVRETTSGPNQGSPVLEWIYEFIPSNYEFYLGQDFANGRYWDGQIDEVSIYNRALEATEIVSIYGAGDKGKCELDGTLTPTATRTPTATPTPTQTSTPGPSPTPSSDAPVIESFAINAGALTTTSTNVNLILAYSDANNDLESVSVSNDGVAWSDWDDADENIGWTLPSGDGVKTVYLRARDAAGHISEIKSDSITLDTTVESEFSVSVNQGALYTNQVGVSLKIGSKTGTSQMQVSNDGGFVGAIWEPYTSTRAWEITEYDGSVIPRTVYVRFKDSGGNVVATASDDIILDVKAPTGSVNISANNAAEDIGAVTLNLNASDDLSGVGGMRLSNRSDFQGASWISFASNKSWDLAANQVVFAQFRDNAGNVSKTYATTSCSVKPSTPKVKKPKNGASVNVTQVKLDWSDSKCGTTFSLVLKADSPNGKQVGKLKPAAVSEFTTKTLARGKTYYWQVKACNVKGCVLGSWWSFKIPK